MTPMQQTKAMMNVLLIVTAIALVVLSPSVSLAAVHCESSVQTSNIHYTEAERSVSTVQPGQHDTHNAENTCCIIICGLKAGIPASQFLGPLIAEMTSLRFADLTRRLTGRSVSPPFEPPRLFA